MTLCAKDEQQYYVQAWATQQDCEEGKEPVKLRFCDTMQQAKQAAQHLYVYDGLIVQIVGETDDVVQCVYGWCKDEVEEWQSDAWRQAVARYGK